MCLTGYTQILLQMKSTLTIALLLSGALSFAQEVATPLIDAKTEHPQEWTSYVSQEDFSIDYKFSDCDPSMGYDNESVLLRITNHSSEKVSLLWYMDLYFDNDCKTCDYPDEYLYKIIIEPNQTVSGHCEIDSDYRLKIFSKFIDANRKGGASLTGFQLRKLNREEH